jgi:hypothetical protein
MNPVIKYACIGTWVFAFVLMQVGVAKLSPQHAEFLKMMFWDFPIALAQAWIPGL